MTMWVQVGIGLVAVTCFGLAMDNARNVRASFGGSLALVLIGSALITFAILGP